MGVAPDGDHAFESEGVEAAGDIKCFDEQENQSSSQALTVTLRTLSGDSCQATLSQSAKTEDLKSFVAQSSLSTRCTQHLLAAEGCLLAEGVRLQEQGVMNDSIIDVVCATPAPELVRVECKGLGCGPSIRGSCGTFRRAQASRSEDGRPTYIRDSSLSKWNSAMQYHGDGQRYLVYEDHQLQGKRWALTDDKDWVGYADRCYAFIASDAYHPGYLESVGFGDSAIRGVDCGASTAMPSTRAGVFGWSMIP